MRAALDWSHELLSEAERTLFGRLSVFAGGFPLAAAEEVAASGAVEPERVMESLGNLAEQSLVTVEPDAGGTETRYGMLEPLRQYARDKLGERGEEEQVRARHAAFYGVLARRAGPELRRADQAAWLDRLAHEHDNLRTALGWLLERGDVEQAVGIGWGICLFWSLRGHAGEGRRWMERALAPGDSLPPGVQAKALLVVGILSFARGEIDRVVASSESSLAEASAAKDEETVTIALLLRGLAAVNTGELDAAERDLALALSMFRRRDDSWGAAYGINGLALVAMARGASDRADALLAEADGLLRASGDWFMLAGNLNAQALAARLRGDEAGAEAPLRESIELAGALRDAWTVVVDATGLAGVAVSRGRAERAARLFGAAEALREKTGVGVSWSAWRGLNERDLASTREALGPEAFEAARAEGRAMTLEETVAEVLAEGA
jgi:tetratricopeptide (TPR) repeat protein